MENNTTNTPKQSEQTQEKEKPDITKTEQEQSSIEMTQLIYFDFSLK